MSERIMPKTYFTTATIASGASLSAEIDGRGMRLVKIFMPTAWTSAAITFAEAEASGGTFDPLYTDASSPAEVTIPVAASQTVVIGTNKDSVNAMGYFKIRSGTAASAVNQAGARVIGLLFTGA